MNRADFRQFYRDAHNVSSLTDREKMLLGLAVAIRGTASPEWNGALRTQGKEG